MSQAKTLTTTEIEQLLSYINSRKYSARNRSMMLLTHWAGLRIGEVACLRWSDVTTTDGEIKDEIRLLPDMTKGRHARTVLSAQSSKRSCNPTQRKPSAWIAATHSSQAKRVSGQALTQTAWPKHSLYFTKALDLKVLAVTAVAERF